MTMATVVSLEQAARARPSRSTSPASPTPARTKKHTQVSQKDMLYIVVKLCQAALSAVLHRRQWQRRRRRAAGATRLIHEIAAMSRISNGQVRSARKSAICGAKVDDSLQRGELVPFHEHPQASCRNIVAVRDCAH